MEIKTTKGTFYKICDKKGWVESKGYLFAFDNIEFAVGKTNVNTWGVTHVKSGMCVGYDTYSTMKDCLKWFVEDYFSRNYKQSIEKLNIDEWYKKWGINPLYK